MMLKIFCLADVSNAANENTVNEWLKTPNLRVQTKHFCHGDRADWLYIFYETRSDDEHRKNIGLIEENAQMEMCMDVAKSLKTDQFYKSLSNRTQRRLYLLHTKNLPAGDSDIVMELMTPALSKMLG